MLKTLNEISWLTIDQWQSYVESQTNSCIFHHRNWLELLSKQYGFKLQIPAIVNEGEIRAAIPLLQTRSLRGKKKLISLPFTDYLQVLSQDQQSLEVLCQLMQDEFRDQVQAVVIRSDEPINGLSTDNHNVRHDLRTDRPFEEVESDFASAIKRNVRKGQRRQLEFQQRSDEEAIEIYYRLHVLTRKKLGVPVQSKTFFRGLHNELIKNGLGWVGVVSRNSVSIAAGVMLEFNGRLTYKYAASDPSALEDRPNDTLVYNAIRIAAEEDYRYFDFGISAKSQEGLRRFKKKWGAVESDIFYNYVLGQPDDDGGKSLAMTIAAEVIKRSPTFVCRALGKAFYKYSQ